MAFNLQAKRRNDFLKKLRSLPGCEQVRPSDLEGLDETDMQDIFYKNKSKDTKIALHGNGETFVRNDADYSPYKTSPLVNWQGPEFGGNQRRHNYDFPGAGDMHINDDNDKQKNLRGNAVNEDFDPDLKTVKINDALDSLDDKKRYIIRVRLPENQQPTKEKAKEFFGDNAQTDGTSVYVVIKGYRKALDLMNKVPGCCLEPC